MGTPRCWLCGFKADVGYTQPIDRRCTPTAQALCRIPGVPACNRCMWHWWPSITQELPPKGFGLMATTFCSAPKGYYGGPAIGLLFKVCADVDMSADEREVSLRLWLSRWAGTPTVIDRSPFWLVRSVDARMAHDLLGL